MTQLFKFQKEKAIQLANHWINPHNRPPVIKTGEGRRMIELFAIAVYNFRKGKANSLTFSNTGGGVSKTCTPSTVTKQIPETYEKMHNKYLTTKSTPFSPMPKENLTKKQLIQQVDELHKQIEAMRKMLTEEKEYAGSLRKEIEQLKAQNKSQRGVLQAICTIAQGTSTL